MLDVKVHNRQAEPLKRRQTILKADGNRPITDVTSGLMRLLTPLSSCQWQLQRPSELASIWATGDRIAITRPNIERVRTSFAD